MDHDDLRVLVGCKSLADATVADLLRVLKTWTNKPFRKGPTTRRGYGKTGELELVSTGDLELLGRAFDRARFDDEARAAFTRRQLDGRLEIRTKADFHRVFSGIRAMNRRNAA